MLQAKCKQQTKVPTPKRHIDKLSPVADKELGWSNMGSQRLHFNPPNKRNNRSLVNSTSSDPITPQHEENIAALFDEWDKVRNEFNRPEHADENQRYVVEYVERNPNQSLQNFRPFDLEEFWGQKQLRNVK